MYEIFKKTLNLIPNGVIILDIKSKRVQFINDEIKGFMSQNHMSVPMMDLTEEQIIEGLSKFYRIDSEASDTLWQFILDCIT